MKAARVATREYMGFTLDEVNTGLASGWALAVGWFPYQQSAWAWFTRQMPHG